MKSGSYSPLRLVRQLRLLFHQAIFLASSFDTKMRQLQTEMRDLLQQEEASKEELKALFEQLGYSL
jgi:shikimate kinase